MSLRILACLMMSLALLATTAFAADVVSLNKGSAAQIQAISPKIPESLAKEIVAYREKNGPFKKADDLLKVPGMTQDFFEVLNPIEENGDLVHDPDAEPLLAPSKC
jgi:competence protein ComEA